MENQHQIICYCNFPKPILTHFDGTLIRKIYIALVTLIPWLLILWGDDWVWTKIIQVVENLYYVYYCENDEFFELLEIRIHQPMKLWLATYWGIQYKRASYDSQFADKYTSWCVIPRPIYQPVQLWQSVIVIFIIV